MFDSTASSSDRPFAALENRAHSVAELSRSARFAITLQRVAAALASTLDRASVLDDFAAHGGTGTHRAVEDEASLLNEFQKITAQLVSCTYDLEEVPPDPSYVLVRVDGKQLNLNQPDGWSIKGATITIEGQACRGLQDGKAHELRVEVKCDAVPVI